MVNEELLKFSTFNCRGLGDGSKRRTVLSWLKRYHSGIIFLQETHSTELSEKEWKKIWNGQLEFCHGKSSARGVAILIARDVDIHINEIIRDNTGRFLLLDTIFEGQRLILVNVYAPTKDQREMQLNFLDFIQERLQEYADKNLIIGGDFNTCLNPVIDKKGGTIEHGSKAAEKLLFIMEEFNLVDIWRLINHDSLRYTRREMTRGGLVQSRLDYWLISNHILYDYHDQEISPGLKSDHSLVALSLKIRDSQIKGRGFFKFNSSLLKDKTYVDKLKDIISNFKIEHSLETNKGLLWDALKCRIRGFSISYSSAKTKERHQYENELKDRLLFLEANLDEENLVEYSTIKQQVEQINHEHAMGAQIRSKARFTEENESNLSFFTKMETRNYNTRYIRTLLINENTLVTDPDKILKEEEIFYKSLYTEPTNLKDSKDYLAEIDTPKLSDNDVELCDAHITVEELGKALKDMPNKKSPGTDGLTADFYKFFWRDIKDIVFNSLTYAFENNSLSIEQKRGILCIIPKKGKDLRRLKNWRPLTLLNTDYKTLTKLLASRLQRVLPSLISRDQSGYLKGRYIGENIRSIYDTINFAAITDSPGMIVALDFEKAFDSISWSFLFNTLETFNFGPYFRKWISIIYSDPQCCVTNNGHYSSFFNISRGIRQGCPISALLFILVVEVMAIQIRQSSKVRGIQYSDRNTITISQLADDTTLFLEDKQSLEACIQIISDFSETSGLRLNTEKSEAFWIGSGVSCKDKPFDFKWTSESIKCLGVWCSADVERAIEQNFNEKIKKLSSLLNMWSQRKLSLKGKVAVLRSIILPQILYIATVLYTPEWVIEKVENLFFNFLWSGKKHHVKKEVVIKEIQNGGLKMPSFKVMIKAIKCTWVKRILNDNYGKTDLLRHFVSFKHFDIQTIIKSKVDMKFLTVHSAFYCQVLKYWYELYAAEPTSAVEILAFPLWNNKYILVDKKPVALAHWSNHDIEQVGDLLDNNGKIMSKNQIERRYAITVKQMDYNSISHAIPKNWLRTVKGKNVEYKHIPLDSLYIKGRVKDIGDAKCRDFYWEYICKIVSKPKAEDKWKKYLSTGSDDMDWPEYYAIPYRVCRSTMIQSLQYKIFHRFFPCNYTLSIWYDDQSPKCIHCNMVDFPEHYFYQCQEVSRFWTILGTWWKSVLEIDINIQVQDVLFGILNYNDDIIIDILNFCIIYAKWYIYKCKIDGIQLFLPNFVQMLKDTLEIEQAACILSDSDTFEKKWSILYNAI